VTQILAIVWRARFRTLPGTGKGSVSGVPTCEGQVVAGAFKPSTRLDDQVGPSRMAADPVKNGMSSTTTCLATAASHGSMRPVKEHSAHPVGEIGAVGASGAA